VSAPLVSVVIATRNRPHLLRLALASISAQEGLPVRAVEVVVVNDGGTDLTGELACAAEAGLRIRSLALPTRRGLPAARNVGIDAACGEFLAFLDDDDLYLPGHLRAAIEALDNGEVDAAYTTCLISPVRVDPAHPLPGFPASIGYPFDPGLLSVANLIAVHSVVLHRPADAGARFDRGLDALEDWDFWLRLSRDYGYRFVHITEPTVIYHRIAGQASMCGSTVSDAAALNRFGVLVQRLWQRWPPTGPRAARFRAYLGVMYWHAFSLLAAGQPLDDLYFQRCLRILADAWAGNQTEDDIIDRVRHAVQGDPVAAHTA
jgi:glycosyltransferase involved in cell wall biosynthesis